MATSHKYKQGLKREKPPTKLGERWKEVPGWFGVQVSTLGRVWRFSYHDTIGRFWPAKLRTQTYATKRGFMTSVKQDNIYKQDATARLMLTVFIREPVEGEVARHLNDNNRRNVLPNLAWGLPQDNSDDAVRNGRSPRGERNCKAKLTPDNVRYIRRVHVSHHREFGASALARKFGISSVSVDYIIHGKNWGWLDGYQS